MVCDNYEFFYFVSSYIIICDKTRLEKPCFRLELLVWSLWSILECCQKELYFLSFVAHEYTQYCIRIIKYCNSPYG